MNGLFFQTSTVADGNMSPLYGDETEVEENQRRWLQKIGINPTQLCLMRCDHGEKIVVVTPENFITGERPEAEALTTSTPNIILGLLTADCIPAIFFDPVTATVALAHLNRKTIAHDLSTKVVERMQTEFAVDPVNLHVHFEPHIQPESYAFPLPLHEPTPPQLAPYITEKDGQAHVDFPSAHKYQLTEVGVPETNITSSSINVLTAPEYFSHNYSKAKTEKPNGRHLTVVTLR